MKPAPFKYFAPDSLEAALELKAQHGDEAKPLAGGQSLIPAMNFRVAQPSILIDLNRIPELRGIRANGALTIGGMTAQSAAEKDALVAQHTPLLHEAIPNIAHPQIRNRGTIGGSVAHADPAAELPVVCLALRARMLAQSQSGQRWIEAQQFFAGLFTTALSADELLTAVEFPLARERTGYAFLEVARRHGDYAMAGLAAVLALDENGACSEARLVYLNVGDGPLEATQAVASLVGKKPSEEAFAEAAQIASQVDMQPFGNLHATPDFQRHLSGVLTQRALNLALSRIPKKAAKAK
ncbi:MAG: xanthine dehydrogenase family protein subunit M [Anaerolineales bacterium]|nr:xanthine dehydrogenase family protein subunit M [Anaerolineales bacterium]